jgi:ABC-type enterochelin transport system substrate-binding protein
LDSTDLARFSSIAPVILLSVPKTILEAERQIESFGCLTGHHRPATNSVYQIRRKISAYKKLLKFTKRKKLMFLMSLNKGILTVLSRPSVGADLIYTFADIPTQFEDTAFGHFEIGCEFIAQYRPDHIIIAINTTIMQDAYAELLSNCTSLRGYQNIKNTIISAVDVHDGFHWESLYPMGQLADIVCTRVYPETFPAPLTEAQIAAVLDG